MKLYMKYSVNPGSLSSVAVRQARAKDQICLMAVILLINFTGRKKNDCRGFKGNKN